VATIAWTDEAQRWLREIYDYIAEDNSDAAAGVVLGIHERTTILLTFPEIGHRYRDNPDVRVLLYGHYRIAYLVNAKRDIIILGVFHGALDITRYLTRDRTKVARALPEAAPPVRDDET
jgi:toxin ParE1/3/4